MAEGSEVDEQPLAVTSEKLYSYDVADCTYLRICAKTLQAHLLSHSARIITFRRNDEFERILVMNSKAAKGRLRLDDYHSNFNVMANFTSM